MLLEGYRRIHDWLVRQGLRAMIDQQPGLRVVGEASSVRSAAAMLDGDASVDGLIDGSIGSVPCVSKNHSGQNACGRRKCVGIARSYEFKQGKSGRWNAPWKPASAGRL